MLRLRRSHTFAAALALAGAFAICDSASAVTPSFRQFSTVPGGNQIETVKAVSADGSVVVGERTAASGPEAYRWTLAGGIVGLGDLAGGTFESRAYGVSANGATVVGSGTATNTQAFRWTSAGGMVSLGTLPGGSTFSRAAAISGNGQVIVGDASHAPGTEAFRWTSATGMTGLGDLPGGNYASTNRQLGFQH